MTVGLVIRRQPYNANSRRFDDRRFSDSRTRTADGRYLRMTVTDFPVIVAVRLRQATSAAT